MATSKEEPKTFRKDHKMFYYSTIFLAVVVIALIFAFSNSRCKIVPLEEAVPYTAEEAYLVTEETDVPLKYGSYHWILPTYYNLTYYSVVKVYVKNIDEKSGYFTTHVNISNSTDTSYKNETNAIEKNQEVLFYFEYEEGQKDQNVTVNYWITPGTQKKVVTFTKYRNVTSYKTETTSKTVCV